MKFGLCYWNRWGDDIVDRPDNTDEMVVSHIIDWLYVNGKCNHVYQLQCIDDDKPQFSAEHAMMRRAAWLHMKSVAPGDEPDLDVMFCRWRWDLGKEDDPRIEAQDRMLAHYANTPTRIIIWDEDFQMSSPEFSALQCIDNVELVETSEMVRKRHDDRYSYVPHPLSIDIDSALVKVLPRWGMRHGDHIDPSMRVAYVGNNYEREEYLSLFLGHEAAINPKKVHLYGNWLKYDIGVQARHHHMAFHPKVGRVMRDWVYQHAVCVPMLAKGVYFERGHITPRLHEVVHAGGIPVGFNNFLNAERYYPEEHIAENHQHFSEIVSMISQYDHTKRREMLGIQMEMLRDNRIFDVDHFFESIGLER